MHSNMTRLSSQMKTISKLVKDINKLKVVLKRKTMQQQVHLQIHLQLQHREAQINIKQPIIPSHQPQQMRSKLLQCLIMRTKTTHSSNIISLLPITSPLRLLV